MILNWASTLALMGAALGLVVVSALLAHTRRSHVRSRLRVLAGGYTALWLVCLYSLLSPAEVHVAVRDVPSGATVSCLEAPVDLLLTADAPRTAAAEACRSASEHRLVFALGAAVVTSVGVAAVLLRPKSRQRVPAKT